MTRQRALRLAREWSQGHVCSLRDGEAAESHSMFAAMLEESMPNEPLTQADLDVMDYDKVWIDYGDDGEWALVVSGRIYALAVLEGAGFEDILRDEVGCETMDRPSGNYTVYRCPPEAKDNNVPTNEPLTIEELREMNGEPVWIVEYPDWGHWELSADAEDYIADRDQDLYGLKHDDPAGQCGLHVLGWLAYRRPPEGDA